MSSETKRHLVLIAKPGKSGYDPSYAELLLGLNIKETVESAMAAGLGESVCSLAKSLLSPRKKYRVYVEEI
ncbi:hypothetical protein ACTXT7_009421 [Hymenolepis weldensis]